MRVWVPQDSDFFARQSQDAALRPTGQNVDHEKQVFGHEASFVCPGNPNSRWTGDDARLISCQGGRVQRALATRRPLTQDAMSRRIAIVESCWQVSAGELAANFSRRRDGPIG